MNSRRNARVEEWITALGLVPHPERGYYVESYRAQASIVAATHPAARAASTAIYYLVTADEPTSYLHRLRSDEVFHLYEGGPLDVLRLFADGTWDVVRLGLNIAQGERPQLVIPAGTWFGTELTADASHCLIGCTVAPGFDFADFEFGLGSQLKSAYPEASERIARLSRPE